MGAYFSQMSATYLGIISKHKLSKFHFHGLQLGVW